MELLEGKLPPRLHRLVLKWATWYQQELLQNWELARKPTTFEQNTTLGVNAILKDIVAVSPQPGYQLDLRFEDGIAGRLNISQLIKFSGIFEPLQDFDYFAQVRVNPELGTIEWPNEADTSLFRTSAGRPRTVVNGPG